MTSNIPNATSSDCLWITIKNHLESKFGDAIKPNWKLISNDVAGCEVCSEYGGGVLIKCNNERCKREYHIDCAFHQGGLSLELNGNLTFHCTTHFKPVLFCVCREKYDEFRAMICCDQCIEWYHCSCVGLQDADADKLEEYQCQSCTNLLEQRKPIPPALKEKNLLKENISSCQQTANKAIGHLVEVAGTIGPLIDLMNSGFRTKYPIEKINEALEFLTSTASTVDSSKHDVAVDGNDENNNADSSNDVERFGTEVLVDSWHKQLSNYRENYTRWLNEAKQLIIDCEAALKPASLTVDRMDVLASFLAKSKALDSAMQSFCFTDVEFFVAFHESLLSIHDIFLILSNAKKEPQSTVSEIAAELNLQYRAANPRIRKLNAFATKEPLCMIWMHVFQEYAQLTHEFCNQLNDWSKRTMNVLNKKSSISLSEIQTLIELAQGIPFEITLCNDLVAYHKEILAFEQQLSSILSSNKNTYVMGTQAEEFHCYVAQAKSMKLAGATYDEFMRVVQVYEIWQRILQADAAARIPINTIQQLQADIMKLISQSRLDTNRISTLRQSLMDEISSHQQQIDAYAQSIDVAVFAAREALQNRQYQSHEILKSLKNNRIISVEEKTIEYLCKIDGLTPTIQDIISYSELSEAANIDDAKSPTVLSSLLHDIDDILSQDDLLSEYEAVRSSLEAVKSYQQSLFELSSACERAWGILSNFLESAEQGDAGSYEDLIETTDHAVNTRFIVDDVLSKAKNFKILSLSNISYCNHMFESSDVDMTSLAKRAENLLSISMHSCLDNVLGKKIKRYHGLCKIVQSCYDILHPLLSSTSHDVYNIIIAEDKLHDDAYVSMLKDLRNGLERMSIQVLDRHESSILQSIRDEFMIYEWRVEAIIALHHRYSYDDASSIQSSIDKFNLSSSLSKTPEYQLLHDALSEAMVYEQQAKEALQQYDDAINEVNVILSSSASSTASYDLVEAAQQRWQSLAQVIYDHMIRIRDSESGLKLSHPRIVHDIKAAIHAIEVLYNASSILIRMHMIITASDALDHKHSRDRHHVIELWALQNLSTYLGHIVDQHPSFHYAKALHQLSCLYHNDSSSWNDDCVSLLPQKSTRYKVNLTIKQRSIDDLESALLVPIAQAVLTPMHERLYMVLQDVASCRDELLSIIMPSSSSQGDVYAMDVAGEGETSSSSRKKVATSVAEYNIAGELFAQLGKLYALQLKLELIPLDMMELRVLKWVSAVYAWMQDAPVPPPSSSSLSPDHHHNHDYMISYNVAKHKLEEGMPLIAEIPQGMVDCLVSLGIINIDENVGAVGFHQDVHRDLRRSGDYYEYLEALIADTDEMHDKIIIALRDHHTKTSPTSIASSKMALQQLYDDAGKCIVQIDVTIKRDLDRAIHASSSTAAVMKAPRERLEEVDDADTSYIMDNIKNRKRNRDFADGQQAMNRDHHLSRTYSTKPSSSLSSSSYHASIKKMKIRYTCMKCQRDMKRNDMMYCGDYCAMQNMSDYLKALTSYRHVLNVDIMQHHHQHHHMPGVPVRDVDAYMMMHADKTCLDRINYAIHRRGLHQHNDDDMMKMMSGDMMLQALLSYEVAGRAKGWTATSDMKSRSGVASLSYELSSGAQSAIIHASSSLESSSSSSSDSNNNISPRNQGSFAFPPSSSSSSHNNDADFRMSVRLGFEEIFISCLQKHHMHGALELGAIFAGDVEEELYLKHTASSSSSGGGEWNKKEYKNQMLMMRRNMKQSHNEHLILDLVLYKVSMDKLLNMTHQEFADVSTKLKREQEHENFMKESSFKSMQDEIEANRRHTMTGMAEAWRQDSKGTVGSNLSSSMMLSSSNMMMDVSLSENAVLLSSDITSDGDVADNIVSSPSKSRSGYVDAGKRLITSSSRAVDDDVIEMTADDHMMAADDTITSYDDGNSNNQAPNIVDLLQSSSSSSMIINDDDDKTGIASPSSSYHRVLLKGSVRLICDDGATSFTIVHPGSSPIACFAAVTDRRIQGLLKAAISVDYRTRISELEKFIIQSSASGRKIIATCRIFVRKTTSSMRSSPSSTPSSYMKFCKEFSDDRKAGLMNVRDQVQFYVVPPQLKGSLSILRSMEGDDVSHTLYGIIVSREEGPARYVNIASSYDDMMIDDDEVDDEMIGSPAHDDDKMEVDDDNGLEIPASIQMMTSTSSAPPQPAAHRPIPTSSSMMMNRMMVSNPTSSSGGLSLLSSSTMQPHIHAHAPPRPLAAGGLMMPGFAPRPTIPSYPPNGALSLPRPPGALSSMMQPQPRPAMMLPPQQHQPRPVMANHSIISFDSHPHAKQREIIRQISQFCADNGPDTITMLKKKDTARASTPFLFEGHVAYEEFNTLLKQLLGRKS